MFFLNCCASACIQHLLLAQSSQKHFEIKLYVILILTHFIHPLNIKCHWPGDVSNFFCPQMIHMRANEKAESGLTNSAMIQKTVNQ